MQRDFKRDPEKPFVASQSSLGTLMGCEEKFVHRYYKATPRDDNWVSPTYFAFGTAFHEILHFSQYNKANVTELLIRGHVEINGLNWDNDGAKVIACLDSYFENHTREEKFIASEVEIFTDEFVMYADAIFEDKDGWYIADMKTVGFSLDPYPLYRLKRDNQMCLYAAHAKHFAEKLGLDPDKFTGMSYREVEKPRQRIRKNELHDSFLARCKPTPYRETFLTPDMLLIDETMFSIKAQLQRARSLKAEMPIKNTQNCKRNGLVCEFWSQCYGEEYKYES